MDRGRCPTGATPSKPPSRAWNTGAYFRRRRASRHPPCCTCWWTGPSTSSSDPSEPLHQLLHAPIADRRIEEVVDAPVELRRYTVLLLIHLRLHGVNLVLLRIHLRLFGVDVRLAAVDGLLVGLRPVLLQFPQILLRSLQRFLAAFGDQRLHPVDDG